MSTIVFDNEHHRLIINGRVPPLSHMEYRLIQTLYAQYEEYIAGQCASCFVSATFLTKHIGTRNMQSFYRRVSSARLKLEPYKFEIIARWGQGYIIVPPRAG